MPKGHHDYRYMDADQRHMRVVAPKEPPSQTSLDHIPGKTGLDGFQITRPGIENERNPHWKQRERLYTIHAKDDDHENRKWSYFVESSAEDPVRFRAAVEHYHDNKHEPQLYTIEFNDEGGFYQNVQDIAKRMPPAPYQSMIGLTVALRDVRHRTLQAVIGGKIDLPGKLQKKEAPSTEDLLLEALFPEQEASAGWTNEKPIYDILVRKPGADTPERWEVGIEETTDSPTFFRAFVQQEGSGKRTWLAVSDEGGFISSDADLGVSSLPEAVYAGMYGLAVGAQVAKQRTLQACAQGRSFMTPVHGHDAANAQHDAGSGTRFVETLVQQRAQDAIGKAQGGMTP